MARGFAGFLSIDATPKTLAAMLVTGGFAGSMVGKYLLLRNSFGVQIIYRGDAATVSAVNGVPMQSGTGVFEREADSPDDAIDPGNIWLVRPAGAGQIEVTWEPI